MPDFWMDVDTALGEVPVNIMPLLDDTDFKTRETAVAFDAAGMDLVWNFVTTAGAFTQTAVTPTSGGNYDWAHQGDGIYTIEIPASGGASINNDTEGFGWFTGFVTGVLPWRGPTIGFRASGLNDKLIDSAYSTTRGLAGTALPDAAAEAAGGVYTRGTGAGQINQNANGQVDTRTVAMANDVVTAAAIATGAIDADAIADNAIDAGAIAADAITSAKIADGAITAAKIANGAIDAATFAAGAIDAAALAADAGAEIADAVWDEALSGHQTAGTAGRNLTIAASILGEFTLTGTPTSTVLRISGGSAVNDYYNDLQLLITSGALIGQARPISDYDGGTGDITVDEAFTSAPASGVTVAILASHAHPVTQIADSLLDRTAGVETGLTPRQWFRLAASALFGKASGLATTTAVYRDFGDSKDRITATVDADGNRTAVTRDAT